MVGRVAQADHGHAHGPALAEVVGPDHVGIVERIARGLLLAAEIDAVLLKHDVAADDRDAGLVGDAGLGVAPFGGEVELVVAHDAGVVADVV